MQTIDAVSRQNIIHDHNRQPTIFSPLMLRIQTRSGCALVTCNETRIAESAAMVGQIVVSVDADVETMCVTGRSTTDAD